MTQLESKLLAALNAWDDFDRESPDRQPVPDARYRKTLLERARMLTIDAMLEAQDAGK